jgi:glycosyltransferase involved in cell wall biosynthesis
MIGAGNDRVGRPSFCVVIPMYNEEVGAEACIRAVCAALDALPNRGSLVVVNDGSRDRTRAILDRLGPSIPKLRVLTHEQNRGYGQALRTGIEQAARDRYDYALFMDSDLTNEPADIRRFAAEMDRGTDVIKASRYVEGGRTEDVPFSRALISRIGNKLASMLFGIGVHDCTNGFRAVRVAILTRMTLRENGFPIILEELYQAKFLATTYAELAVVLRNRQQYQRRTSFSYKPSTFCRYLGYAVKARLGIRPGSGETR